MKILKMATEAYESSTNFSEKYLIVFAQEHVNFHIQVPSTTLASLLLSLCNNIASQWFLCGAGNRKIFKIYIGHSKLDFSFPSTARVS